LHKIRQVQLTEEDDYKNTFLYLVSVGSIWQCSWLKTYILYYLVPSEWVYQCSEK
jgi:hypothetical protein